MKTFIFPAVCRFGPGDSGESEVEVELTDSESELLLKYGTDATYYYKDFLKCKELKELYEKIYEIAVDQMTDELDGADWLEAEQQNKSWRADDTYQCEVFFPREFEDMLDED